MSTPESWSSDVVLEVTSSENVPEAGMQVEIECVETVHTPETLYCHCRRPWTKEFMIMCESCRDWFHGSCVNINEGEALDIDKYHCINCEPLVGKTIYKNEHDRPILAGSELFIRRLKNRVFVSADEIITKERGQNLNVPNLFLKGFNRPVVVDEVDGLGIKVPPESITVRDVERFVGPAMEVEVIEVEKQSSTPMTLRQFIEYFTSPNRTRRLNLLSLEVSDTALGQLIEPPYIARKLDWVLNTWPKGLDEELYQRPKVSKYCLIGSKDSYTDFHIDFGGTSVWYHVLWGEKVFYLIEPTEINLSLYEKWMSSSPKDKYEAFFADTVDYCYKLVLKKGQTLFIPTGWIHAVLTTTDSLVFGGNFLHVLNMDLQLRIYNIEKKLNIKRRYMFPSFEIVHWLAAKKVIEDLGACNDHGAIPLHLRTGAKSLIWNLEVWLQAAKKNGSELIPPNVDPKSIIKSLSRELKRAEKRYASTSASGGRHNAAATVTAELLSQEASITSFSGFLLDDFGKSKRPDRPSFSSPSQDEMSPRSPSQSAPRIKLKIRKDPSQSNSTHSSPSYSSSVCDDSHVQRLSSSNGTSHSHSPGQLSSPRDGTIKIRLSLSESRVELMGPRPKYSVARRRDSDSEHLQIDTDGENSMVGEKRKSSKHHHGHHKKCKNHHRKHREDKQQELNEALQGTLNGMEHLIDSADYHDRVQSSESLDPAIKEAVLEMKQSDAFYKQKLDKKRHKKRDHGKHRNRPDTMNKVHQDDDYIYPSLMVSDDEEDASGSWKKGRSAQETDEAWCPGIKVSKLIPKAERPSRPGAKRESVEKGLSDAATKLANDALKMKRKYKPRSPKLESVKKGGIGATVGSSEADSEVPGSSSSKPKLDIRKKKMPKGMATPKQRLSKILKINRLNKF